LYASYFILAQTNFRIAKALTAGLEAFASAYDAKFDQTFQLAEKKYSPSDIAFARTMTSSLVGGVGYFYGNSLVDQNFSFDWDAEDAQPGQAKEKQPQFTEERELLTATPSRPFFPRGFYWDEGFHLLLISLTDPQLSLDILQSWVNLIDTDGWVGREQILGDEARSKVGVARSSVLTLKLLSGPARVLGAVSFLCQPSHTPSCRFPPLDQSPKISNRRAGRLAFFNALFTSKDVP
jgi:hypothetical protein